VAVTERSRARVIYRLPDQRASRAAGPSVAPRRLSLLLLALVLFSGGLVIGRSTARTDEAAPAAAQPSSVTAANPPRTADAPATGVTRADKAGPAKEVAGVGVGWAHTREGAVAAATNYTMALAGDLVFDDTAGRKAIAVLAAPKARKAQESAWLEAARLTRAGLRLPAGAAGAGQAVMRTALLGSTVEHYDQGKARIAIWTMGLAGSERIPVAAGFGVTVVDLEWVGGDWKQVKATSRAAPIPLAPADEVPSSANDFRQQTRQFKEYDYAPPS
jgi:hypothetical protein